MNIGGPAVQAALLSSSVDRQNFSSVLVAGPVSENEGDMSYLAAESGVRPFVIKELCREPNAFKDIAAFFRLYRLIRKEKPQIVHTHMAKAGALGRLAARLTGVPVIIHTYHGHVFHSYFSPAKTRFFLGVEKALAGFTDKIIVISGLQKDEIKRYLDIKDDDKLALIPLGFELDRYLKSGTTGDGKRLRRVLDIPDGTVVVGTVGRLTAVKNHSMFLEAAKEIKKSFSDIGIKFLIVGDGELRGTLEKTSDELGLRKDVVFTGWRKDMDSVYRAMDIMALTSLNEGTPVSLIEAMASARPVVATDVGGVRDVTEDGKSGFVVPGNDIAAFTKAVSELIRDKEKREAFGVYGRRSIRERYSGGRLIRDIESLYQSALKEKERGVV